MKQLPKKHSFLRRYRFVMFILVSALLLSVVFLCWSWRRAEPHVPAAQSRVTSSKLAYVDGSNATDQVSNFYAQYINPRSSASFRQALVAGYGNKNLTFYAQYYQHGFDPITCSTVMPTIVTASLVSTGPVAFVNARAIYPDSMSATIRAKVVLDDEGLSIDSLSCPGDKGRMPPKL